MAKLRFSDRIDGLTYRTDLRFRNGSFLVEVKFDDEAEWTTAYAKPEDEIILDVFARGTQFRYWVDYCKVANSYGQTFHGFTLQRGHICGVMLNGVKFVTAMERASGGRIWVYLLDGDKWRKVQLPAVLGKDFEIRKAIEFRKAQGISGIQYKPLAQQIRHGYLRPNTKMAMGLPTKCSTKYI